MKRVLQVVVLLVALLGVVGCDAIVDFFESGFADGDGGGPGDDDGGDGQGELTAENLAGNWRINRELSTMVLIGEWEVNGTVDDTFLEGTDLRDPETVTQLEISETKLVFRGGSAGATLGQFDFEILTANELSLIGVTPSRILTTSLHPSGTSLTLTDGTSTAEFTIDSAGDSVITDYDLSITSNQFTSTVAFHDGNTETPEEITETFTIPDTSTIQLTDDNNSSSNVKATLSSNNRTLTLVFPLSERYLRRGTAVFNK